ESLAEYCHKGKQLYLEGKIQTRTWEKDGVKHYSTEVRADRIVLLGGPGSPGQRDAPPRTRTPASTPVTDDDFPDTHWDDDAA
ncbi:MAG TPA: single-stranded DNA-binding protein, partial [Burkholderiaceae bacterium]|nr:single-stranded DNA-binding protein [Burkholderiaceae bacterium]